MAAKLVMQWALWFVRLVFSLHSSVYAERRAAAAHAGMCAPSRLSSWHGPEKGYAYTQDPPLVLVENCTLSTRVKPCLLELVSNQCWHGMHGCMQTC